MFYETDYYVLSLAAMRSQELKDFFRIENMKKKALKMGRKDSGVTLITQILQGTGNALVATGNKLLKIA
ncbi:MAG: hypothetical protein JEY91_09080 [Spirochaetaceae bacterium]|nr:hypothetical protein [Spirochaetaceae bacterium]